MFLQLHFWQALGIVEPREERKNEKEVNKMLTYKGGYKVAKGTYWDLRKGQRVDIAQEGVLPGSDATTYLRASTGVMLLSSPIIGLLYVVFLPFIGIATLAAFAGRKVLGGMASVAGKTISFGWRPVDAYLAGRKKGKKRDNK